MGLRSAAGSAVTVLVIAVLIAMLVGQQIGQPILLGFVVTGSMSPTLDPATGSSPCRPRWPVRSRRATW